MNESRRNVYKMPPGDATRRIVFARLPRRQKGHFFKINLNKVSEHLIFSHPGK